MQGACKRRVLLADRDVTYMHKMKKCLEKNKNMEVIAMEKDGESALYRAEQEKPDIILMDVLLAEKDGIWVLQTMRERKLDIACIIISAIGKDAIVRETMELGAMYYMAKPVQSSILMKRIAQILYEEEKGKQELQMRLQSQSNLSYQKDRKEEMKSDISRLLNKMGIVASIKGYHFIRKGIMMAVENEDIVLCMTKGLYPDIAREYDTTPAKVERAIRHAIESTWKRKGKEIFSEFAGYCPLEKPTNGQFIAALSEYFRMLYKKEEKKLA